MRIKFSIYLHQTPMDTKCEQFYARVILLCVVQIIIFGVVGSISKV